VCRLILDALSMRELSVAEQCNLAVLAVIAEGHPVSSGAQQCGRRCMPGWPGYEAGRLEALSDRSHRPAGCPHQMPAVVKAVVGEPAVPRAD
jgi:hypothetical protein